MALVSGEGASESQESDDTLAVSAVQGRSNGMVPTLPPEKRFRIEVNKSLPVVAFGAEVKKVVGWTAFTLPSQSFQLPEPSKDLSKYSVIGTVHRKWRGQTATINCR